jgi:hypothetical protein
VNILNSSPKKTICRIAVYDQPWAVITVTTAISVALWVALIGPHFFLSDFLYKDDTIYLGSYLLDIDKPPPANTLHYAVISSLVDVGGLALAKCLPPISTAIIVICFSYVLLRCGASALPAVLLSIFIVYYPVSIDQGFFVTGSHPTTATMVFSFYLVLLAIQIGRRIDHHKGSHIALLAAQGILLLACTRLSPVYSLAPLVGSASAVYLAYKYRKFITLRFAASFIGVGILPTIIGL